MDDVKEYAKGDMDMVMLMFHAAASFDIGDPMRIIEESNGESSVGTITPFHLASLSPDIDILFYILKQGGEKVT